MSLKNIYLIADVETLSFYPKYIHHLELELLHCQHKLNSLKLEKEIIELSDNITRLKETIKDLKIDKYVENKNKQLHSNDKIFIIY